MSKISIITPAYNASHYIEETINSVLAQSFTDWEMIIVDDCSKDDTYLIAKELAARDPRIKVIRNDTNLGVAETRNRALDVAKSDYIAFLDADDIWDKEKLEKQITFMSEENIVFSYTYYQKFSGNLNNLKKIIKSPMKMHASRILGDTSIGCLTVMVNRSIVGLFHMPLINHMEDNATWYSILSKGYEGHCLPDVLSYYREGNNTLTSCKKKAAKEQWRVYRTYYNFSILKSSFYFAQYAIRAVIKHYF